MKGGCIYFIISVLVAFIMALSTVAALAAPQAAVSPAVEAKVSSDTCERTQTQPETVARVTDITVSETEPTVVAYDEAAVRNLVSINRVFGDGIYNDFALLEAAQIILLDKTYEDDGFKFIEKSLVNEFIVTLYGREIDSSVGEIEGMPAPDGYYVVMPLGYDLVSHSVGAITAADGDKLEVASTVTVEGFGTTESFEVCTTLSPADNTYGYVILSAEIIK